MVRHRLLVGIVTVLTVSITAPLRAADDATRPAVSAGGEATPNKIDVKAGKLTAAAKIDDPAKAEKVKAIISGYIGHCGTDTDGLGWRGQDRAQTAVIARCGSKVSTRGPAICIRATVSYIVAIEGWHKQDDPELSKLWSQWSKARTAPDKDEFPGEVIAHKIEDVYGSLKPVYETFVTQLGTELTPEQIDAIKEQWSRTPGMTRTYNAYLVEVPGLTDDQKKIIHDHMVLAREAAMLTDNSKEIISIFKVHKVKVEEYVGALEWGKLHSAFVNKGKAAPDAAAAPATDTAR
jgi:hypothetical protein